MNDLPLPTNCELCKTGEQIGETPATHSHEALFLLARCHASAATKAVLAGDVLTIQCARCGKIVVRLRVTGIVPNK